MCTQKYLDSGMLKHFTLTSDQCLLGHCFVLSFLINPVIQIRIQHLYSFFFTLHFSFSVKHQDSSTRWKLSSSIKYRCYFYLNDVLLSFILFVILLTDLLLKTKLTLPFSYPSFFLLFNKDAERQHREVVSIYRTHLLSAAQVRFFLLVEELLLLNCHGVIWCSLCLW